MSKILLDTSAYSEIARGNTQVLDAIQTAESIALTPIILGELLSGFAQGAQETRNINLLNRFLDSHRCSVLSITADSSRYYTHIHTALRKAGAPIPTNDLWIAASAMEHGLTVVTCDEHFLRIPQILCRLCAK
jgi:tRNA(fMet)-specific endonuclease VapC